MSCPSYLEDMKVDEQIEISICDPQRIGEGTNTYVVYKVATKTTLPYYKENFFSVSRRFSDFLALHRKLIERYLNLGIIVPPAPEENVVGMTKVKIYNIESALSDEFIEKGREALERYINRTASHPVLRADSDLHTFLQNQTDFPKATNKFSLSDAGVLHAFSRIEETVGKMTLKMEEPDPWFEEKQRHIEELDKEMRKIHSTAETAINHLEGTSTSTALFAERAATMGMREEDTALSETLLQPAEFEEMMKSLDHQQANRNFHLLSELLNDYIGLIAVIKKVFNRRVKCYQSWMQAKETLSKQRGQRKQIELTRESEASLHILAISGVTTESRKDVVDWEEKVKRGEEEFANISKTIRNEIERFEQKMVYDFMTLRQRW